MFIDRPSEIERYLEYVRCRYGQVTPPTLATAANELPISTAPYAGASAATAPPLNAPAYQANLSVPGSVAPMPGFPQAAQHLPVQQGHPYVAQLIANMRLSPTERREVYDSINEGSPLGRAGDEVADGRNGISGFGDILHFG